MSAEDVSEQDKGRKSGKMIAVDGQDLKVLTESALTWLKTNQQMVNALNVFPVPDGDTGTNMVLTMQAAYNEIANSGEKNVGKMAHAIAQGALMGARGNSGVILSQLWRGYRSQPGQPGQHGCDHPGACPGRRAEIQLTRVLCARLKAQF